LISNTRLVKKNFRKNKTKGKKRIANPKIWKKNLKKMCRNTGKKYISHSKNPKAVKEKTLKPPCGEKCKLKCTEKINHLSRETIFKNYWVLGNLQLQRENISKLMTEVKPQYRYDRVNSNRSYNHAFYFIVNDVKIRVCKKFFKAILDVNDRPIRTVIEKIRMGS
jgi:hypothetical protein